MAKRHRFKVYDDVAQTTISASGEDQSAVDSDLSTTTSTTFQTKLTLTTPTIPAGDYRIGWSFQWGGSDATKSFVFRVYLDDTTEIDLLRMQPTNGGSSQRSPAGGFHYITLTNAVHNFKIQYRAATSGTARIDEAKLELWRIT